MNIVCGHIATLQHGVKLDSLYIKISTFTIQSRAEFIVYLCCCFTMQRRIEFPVYLRYCFTMEHRVEFIVYLRCCLKQPSS